MNVVLLDLRKKLLIVLVIVYWSKSLARMNTSKFLKRH